jgi:cell division initiation protein
MNVSPLDLRQQRFATSFRGFDRLEVTAFLSAVADDYEQALRETDRMRQDMMKMEVIINEHREHERTLKTTLITAQKLADEIKAHAEHEAQRILREAEGRTELLLHKGQTRLDETQREIDALKLKRKEVETSLEATIQALRHSLEFVRQQDARDQSDRVLHALTA